MCTRELVVGFLSAIIMTFTNMRKKNPKINTKNKQSLP